MRERSLQRRARADTVEAASCDFDQESRGYVCQLCGFQTGDLGNMIDHWGRHRAELGTRLDSIGGDAACRY